MNLSELQTKVHVGKDKVNSFGGYNYRTAEGILAAIKAALSEGDTITVTEALQEVAGHIFVSSTATVTFEGGDTHSTQGHAMHPLTKKGMDPSQITGAASSYARKYALSGLVALDDGSADPDAAKESYKEDVGPSPEEKAKQAAQQAEQKFASTNQFKQNVLNSINGAENLVAIDFIENHPKFKADMVKLREMSGDAAVEVEDRLTELKAKFKAEAA
tara:strand:+ start:42 stop:692 length:651 start_codon:yes stop_codon:yes gene_type:complete